ncbi:MAG TPA: zinc dependent phospholipase C family protein [Spirochaetota bacterium]|nr:zinc dependent phospholipase C family protein [Spirochaetota bacterium]
MPGIYTHNYIFRKSVESILKNRNRSYINRSIETLFSTPEHFKAGLFGSIGPDIFDYIQVLPKGESYGNEITFALHNKSCVPFLQNMTDIVINNKDSRNEWSSVQRGYLLGYISHIISDSILHPYIFYSSGFPDNMERGEINYFRKKNLRFQYNIDNYFLYRDEWGALIKPLEEMLPVSIIKGKKVIWPSIKYLILESLKRENESLFNKYFTDTKQKRLDGDTGRIKNFDKIPVWIMLCYKIKRTGNPKWISIIDKLCENPLTYSDCFVRYPAPKRIDEDALNIHQGRWQYPAFQRGFRYESVLHLIKFSIEQIVSAWERIEPAIYGDKSFNLDETVILNAYTGEKDVFFEDMKIKDPVKLKV